MSLDSLPVLVRFASIGVAGAAVVFIVVVLIKPRPTRVPAGAPDPRGVSYPD